MYSNSKISVKIYFLFYSNQNGAYEEFVDQLKSIYQKLSTRSVFVNRKSSDFVT